MCRAVSQTQLDIHLSPDVCGGCGTAPLLIPEMKGTGNGDSHSGGRLPTFSFQPMWGAIRKRRMLRFRVGLGGFGFPRQRRVPFQPRVARSPRRSSAPWVVGCDIGRTRYGFHTGESKLPPMGNQVRPSMDLEPASSVWAEPVQGWGNQRLPSADRCLAESHDQTARNHATP